MGKTRHFVRVVLLWAPAVVWMTVIFTCSSYSTLPSPEGFEISDKVQHFAAYAVLGLLAYIAVRKTMPGIGNGYYSPVTLLIVALYGVTDEFHQYFIPGRRCELADWLADVAGGIAVVAVVALYNRLQRRIRDFGAR